MKPLILTFILLLSGITLHAENTHTFNISSRKAQVIDGFGASDAWSFWQIGTWEDSIQNRVADWLFSKEMDTNGNPLGIGLSIWRFNAGAGSAEQGDSAHINRDTRTYLYERQTGQRTFLKLAQARGVENFLAFYNTPPVHLTQNGLGTNTGRGGNLNLRSDAYGDFATYIADMLEKAKKEDNIDFNYISPFNEPDGHWNWQGPKQEGTPATNREIAKLVRLLNDELVKRSIDTKIIINESSDLRCMLGIYQTDWQRGNEIQCFWNPDSTDTYVGNLQNVVHTMAGHSYWTNTPILKKGDKGYNRFGLYGYRKRLNYAFSDNSITKHNDGEPIGFWMSELCIMSNDEEIHGGGGFDFTMEVALYVARVMHYDLTVANAKSWQWWRAAGGNYKDGLLRMYPRNHNVRESKLMWTLGNYSRFIRPDAVRLETEGEMQPDGVMLSAYKNTDGTTVIVAINYSDKDQQIKINGLNAANGLLYRTSDVQNENLSRIGECKLSDVQLKKRSVSTILVK